MRIGIVGEQLDAEAAAVAERLRVRGATPAFLDFSGFPKVTQLSLHVDAGGPRIVRDGEDISDCQAWYVRRFGYADPLLKSEPTREEWIDIYPQFREWVAAENQKAMTVASLLFFLEELAPVINPPAAFVGHNRKPHQVHLLQKAGLPVPDFLVTNDADAVRAFLDRHPRVIYKPVAGGRLTREIDRALVDARAHALATEPILVQALAEGDHVRAYVADGKLVGAGLIHFDKEVRMDYRASPKGASAYELPAHVAEECIRAADACGMPFTGLDVIVDKPRGTHLFLECNPAPMFVNFQRMTGIPVVEALVDLLLDRAKA